MAKKSNPTPEIKSDLSPVIEEALLASDTLTIKAAVALSGLSEVYIRKALRAGKLVATKEPVSEGSKTMRNVITTESFVAWRESAGTHSKREDGRNKFVLYMSPEEETALRDFVANGFTGIFSRANIKTEPAAE